jgi:hypothetical protein
MIAGVVLPAKCSTIPNFGCQLSKGNSAVAQLVLIKLAIIVKNA